MRHPLMLIWGLQAFLLSALASVNDQVNAPIDRGSFENPAARVRPRFRYWLPDASVDVKKVQDNIKSAGDIGAGGVEFLAFYNYGAEVGGVPNGTDWTQYGFGTPAYKELFLAALQTHKDEGMVMDFPLGPNQGQGVPADPNDEGLQWDLTHESVVFSGNGRFNGKIPGWGSGELVALVSAEVLSTKNISLPTSTISLLDTSQTSYLKLTLKDGTLHEWTDRVSSTGHVSLKLPKKQSSTYRLFAFYQTHTLNKNLEYTDLKTSSITGNGSYIVDHYSARGAQTTTDFWDTHLLTDEIESLLKEVGNYAWEDSVEITSDMSWTPSLPEIFESKHGYSIKPFLPLLMFGDNNVNVQSAVPGDIQCLLDTDDQGAGYLDDYREALVEGYRQYLQALTSWANDKLNLQSSTQVSYNLPMDMEANIPFVNAPECESLQFVDNIDGYRQFSGPANLAGKRIISNEMGAVMYKAYNLPHSDLLWRVNRAIVGGVNQVVLHGQSYTGNWFGTTWPGYTAFSYLFSELYSDKQPSWSHGFGDVLNYIARVQFLQQSGVPRTDVAIYNKVSATNPNFPTLYSSNDLINAGYSYSYLSPDNFNLPEAKVKNGTLGPDGPAYKALVITSSSNMTLSGMRYIQEYANSGLPVILSGGDPGVYASGNGSESSAIKGAVQKLKKSRNVYSVSSGHVATKLQSLGIKPHVAIQTNGTWYATWREDPQTAMDHAFVYCEGKGSNGTVTIQSSKTPILLNPWTGETTALINYQRRGGQVQIPLNLATNQTVVIGFVDKNEVSSGHVSHTNIPNLNSAVGADGQLHVTSAMEGGKITLSNATTIRLPTGITKPVSLSAWTLTAEHWEAPSNISDASIIAAKRNTTHHLPSLVSWSKINELKNVSGIGYYSTNFSWPLGKNSGRADSAFLTLPAIKHAARLFVNGKQMPPLDLTAPRVDLSEHLHEGNNHVSIEVPTTMWNYIRSIFSEIEFAGAAPILTYLSSSLPALSDNGLIGEVQLVPYARVDIGP